MHSGAIIKSIVTLPELMREVVFARLAHSQIID